MRVQLDCGRYNGAGLACTGPSRRLAWSLMAELSLSDLVRNGTMSPQIAATLGAAVTARRSFLVVARPRLAGKTTVVSALLSLIGRDMPIRELGSDGVDVARLAAEAHGGYLVVPEVSQHPVTPGYVWGAPVRQAFRAIAGGAALAASLHADGVNEALEIIRSGNEVPDEDVARLDLVIHLRSLGPDWRAPVRRVVAAVDEIEDVRAGPIRTRLLHRWDEAADRFETLAVPTRFTLAAPSRSSNIRSC